MGTRQIFSQATGGVEAALRVTELDGNCSCDEEISQRRAVGHAHSPVTGKGQSSPADAIGCGFIVTNDF